MNISDESLAEIEEKLREMAELDPADIPDPAAELAQMLSDLLDDAETA